MKAIRIFFLAALCVACSSTEDDNTEKKVDPTGPKTYVMTIDADKGNDTRALSLDDKRLNSTWAQGEEVTVYNVTKSADISGSLVAQSSGASTTLKGTLTGTIEKGDELKLKFLSPNYDSQEGTLEYIAANCDYAEATVTVASVDGGNITTTGTAAFANQQAIVKFVLKDEGNSPLSASSLKVSNYANSCTVTLTPASNEIFVAIPGFSDNLITLTASAGGNTYDFAKTGVTFANSSFHIITVKMTQCVDLASVTSDHAGKIIGVDGKIYSHVLCAEAAGTTASAMVGYVGAQTYSYGYNHGLAISLTDIGKNGEEKYEKMNPSTAKSAASSYTRTRPSNSSAWFLASKNQWINVNGSFGAANLKTKFGTVGGTNIFSNSYWSSTDGTSDSRNTWSYSFLSYAWLEGTSTSTGYVRAFFAF